MMRGRTSPSMLCRRRPLCWLCFPSVTVLVALAASGAATLGLADEFGGLYVVRPDGSDLRLVIDVADHSDLMSPRWSHDGKRLLFSCQRGTKGARSFFIVQADGTGLRQLAPGRVADWSPDDKQLLFKPSSAPPIFVQNLDNSGLTQIANGDSPRWSPDGGRLAVADGGQLNVVDLLSDETRPLFDQPQEKIFEGFAWSFGGKRLAVVVRPVAGARRELLLADAAGHEPRFTPRAKGEMGGFVSFSPDDKHVVFSDALRIRIVNVEGDPRPRIIPGQQGHNRHPDWSPDGEWIAFVGTTEDSK